MDDLISRQAAIDALGEEPMVWTEDNDYALGERNQWQIDKLAIETVPSVQPEPCEDAVSKEAVSSWLKQYGQDVLHGKYKFSLMYIWKNLMDLPSAQPERRWETCFDCPLSHGCPKIKGCTNEQAEQYASEIPKGCPLSAQPEQRWIPCSEKLPEPRVDVWVNSDIGQIQGYYEENVGVWYASFGQGRDYLELIVNAWMPLPESYREDEK